MIKKTLILPLLALAAVAAGCGSDGATNAASYGAPTAAASGTTAPSAATKQPAKAPAGKTAAVAVDIAGFAFAPKAIQAKVGQTITFTNQDSTPHTATATEGAKFDSGELDQGKSFSFTPEKPGTIKFVCSFHPNMTGTISVS